MAGLSVPHFGQGIGAERTVAFHSTSIAVNTCPHFGQRNEVVPRTMITMFFLLFVHSLLYPLQKIGKQKSITLIINRIPQSNELDTLFPERDVGRREADFVIAD